MTLTCDFGGHRDCRSYASWYFVRVPSANFVDTTTVRFRFMGHWANTAQTDHVTFIVTLTFDLGGHGAYDWCESLSSIRIPSLKFVGLAIRKIWRTMGVSINGPSDPDLWSFYLEAGASKLGNLSSKFGNARPLCSGIIRYVRDGRRDGRTDKSNAYCHFLTRGGSIITLAKVLLQQLDWWSTDLIGQIHWSIKSCEIFNLSDLCNWVSSVWSTTIRTQVNDIFSLKCVIR